MVVKKLLKEICPCVLRDGLSIFITTSYFVGFAGTYCQNASLPYKRQSFRHPWRAFWMVCRYSESSPKHLKEVSEPYRVGQNSLRHPFGYVSEFEKCKYWQSSSNLIFCHNVLNASVANKRIYLRTYLFIHSS